MKFLNDNLVSEFRTAINKDSFLGSHPYYDKHFKLCCAVADRLSFLVRYLNENLKNPDNEKDFLDFLIYSNMVTDAVCALHKCFTIEYIYENKFNLKQYEAGSDKFYNYFGQILLNSPLNIDKNSCPTDEDFMKYIRSISFAHPFETNRHKFIPKGIIHYSPYIIPNNNTDEVGIQIYSTENNDNSNKWFITLKIPLQLLKEYIISRYDLLKTVTEKIYEIISNQNQKWLMRKVIVSNDTIDVLNDIIDIFQERYIAQVHSIQKLIDYLSVDITDNKNIDIVNKFRYVITDAIASICNSVNNGNIEECIEIIDKIIYVRPKNAFKHQYLIEKTVTGERNKISACMVDDFNNEIADKWVCIDKDLVANIEFELLVIIACYYEYNVDRI